MEIELTQWKTLITLNEWEITIIFEMPCKLTTREN